ncbi:geranyl transferase [Bacillus sp. SA1-12]|uniref:polyprenyl synthetase family protein n=1 Tax=Bacillus sp. SA1-12 TaxID=1455638 RepID=UPI0006272221|nr:polyprenyl synthetase family protein [Bacillus sp. SA1-12]KKI89063.1 geranyl transferase [Bacillus sp. SA1-12]
MNETLINNEDSIYRKAEENAAQYYQSLLTQVKQKIYISTLKNDFHDWKKNHIRHPFLPFLSGKNKTGPKGFHNYIKWLNYTGKLDHYLDRSISYIFMRDLGKALNSQETQKSIRNTVDHLKEHLIQSISNAKESKTETISITWLFRWSQKEGIESAIIWLFDKLKTVAANIPEGMDADHAQRKLIKIIAGVLMHVFEEMDDEIPPEKRKQKLDKAIRLGYCYGLTYPFIDDLLDAKVLSCEEEKQFANLIRTTLLTKSVPELGTWTGSNEELIKYIHSELREAFEYIKSQQQAESFRTFFEQAYVFFHSQEVDRVKDLSNDTYTNEELYLPVILKSASSRLIARSIINAPQDEGFESRTFYYGIYNQLADDFADMFDDMKDGAVTPYTYYMKYHDKRADLINPFELYWTVISNLIHNVYDSDVKSCEVILDRAINGLKRFKERMGIEKYNEVIELFSSGEPVFKRVVQKMVKKAVDVDFFDKLLRDHIITTLKKERQEQEEFSETLETVRNQINDSLKIQKSENPFQINETIIDAANYSLAGDGKRLRPIITWFMGVNEYGLNNSAIMPLLRSLEYMHTASLIFDDLPSQDNSATRRGRPTVHHVYNTAVAELTGLFLTQKAIWEQASLDQFDSKTVLKLIQYSTEVTEIMCKGQAIDLDSKGKKLTVKQLNAMCFYKTGIAFEASLIMPAILAQVEEAEISVLKKFAYHAGIAFQIKDDLLDVEGDIKTLGKPVELDIENNNSTFVTILGQDRARNELWEHYCLAIESLDNVPLNPSFLKHLMDYILNRNH